MKKRCLLLCLMTVWLCLFAGSAMAAQSGYYYYEDHGDGTCTILDYAGPSMAPVFPETLDSLTVTGIDEYVFRLASNSQASMGIQSVTLPDTVTTIAANAFEGCGNMKQITFGSGVKTIGEDAFSDCSSIEAVYVPSLESWLGISFANADSKPWYFNLYVDGVLAEEIVIPSGITAINAYAFETCDSLKSVTIPGSVKTIQSCAFGKCGYLQNLTLSEGVESIASSAFYDCDALQRVVIPSSVTSLSSSAFDYCDNITLVDLSAHNHAPGAGGDSVSWFHWDGSTSLTLASGDNYVALACDVYVPSGITVSKGQHLHLCLDGSDLAANGSSCSATITVNEGGTLSLCDCSAQSDWGRVTSTLSSCRGVSLNKATMYMYSGKVADNLYTSDGAGVSVYSGSAFTMYDGEISGNNDNGKNFIHGAGVLVDYSSTFTMHGGKISGNSGERGAGVRVSGSSSMYMHGGEISGNAAVSGGAIYTPGNNVTIEITGGTITGNTAEGCAAIFNNASPESSASIRILGGSITGNQATSGYGGINGPVTLGGSAVITGNTSAGKASNLASGGSLITLRDGFTGTVGVTPTIPASGSYTPFLKRADGAVTADDLSHFQADNSDYALYVDENGQGVLGQKTYTLTLVNAQTADGKTTASVAPGAEVTISAVVPEGKTLARWENASGEKLDIAGDTFTFTMPIGDATLNAIVLAGYTITEAGEGVVDVTLNKEITSELYTQLLAEVGENAIGTLTISESGVLNCPNVTIAAARVDNYGQLLGGNLKNAVLHNWGTVDGECDLYDLVNYEGATISGDTEHEDGETYYLTYLYGEIENYGTISSVGYSGATVKLNEGTLGVRVRYNSGWDWDEGWGWDSTTATFNYGDRVGDVLGEGFYRTDGTYAIDDTLGLFTQLYHHWTRQESGSIYVKAAGSSLPVRITADMAGDATSIYVAMGQLITDEIDLPVVLSNIECEDGTHYYTSGISGGVYNGTITVNEPGYLSDCTINGTLTLNSGTSIAQSVTLGKNGKVMVNSLNELTNIWGPSISSYDLPMTVADGGSIAIDRHFYGDITNYGVISKGTYYGTVTNYDTLAGGTFNGKVLDYSAHEHAPGAGGDSVSWTRWDGSSTLNLTSGDNYVALACDVSTSSGITVNNGQHLHLCLAGSDLIRTSYGRVITVNDGGALSLCDCSAQSKWGRVTADSEDVSGIFLNGAEMNLYSGKISGNIGRGDGAGVDVYYQSTLTMYGGEISGNGTATTGSYYGGGVNCNSESTFIMYDGKISGNSAARGAGVRVANGSAMYMHGGEISSNTAAEYGGGIYSPGNTVTIEITGGTITDNTATNGGGAIFNAASPLTNTQITITGGSITGNTAGESVGGINGPVTLGGSAVITGNTSAGKASNLVSGSDLITLEGEFTGTVGVTPTIPASGSFTPFLTRTDGAVTAEDLSHFQADNSDYALYVDENGQGVLGQKTYTLTLENAKTEDDQTTVSVAPGTEVKVYPVVPEGQVFVQWENGAGEVLSTENSALTVVMPLGDDTVRVATVDPFVITEKDDGTVDVTIYGVLTPELGAEMMAEVGERSIDTFTIQTEVVVNCGNDIVIPAATVVNNGYIASGTFSGTVINQFVISGGTFTGSLENHGAFYPKFTLSADTVELYDAAVTVTSSLNVSGSSWEWYIAEDVYSDGVLIEGATGDTYRHELLKNGSVYPVQVIPTTKGEVRLKGPRATAAIVDYNIEPIDSYYATIVRCNLQDEVIEIPRSVKGYAIKNIASGAFTSCNPNATITYSGYISEAPEDAFLSTQHVWHITVPTLYSYRGPATEITLPATIEELWTGAFRYNTTLTSISGPAVTNVGVNAFTGCKSLVHASFPAATNYGYAAFSSCVVLESVDRGENPQPLTIGQLAFNCCYKLTGFDFTNVTSLAASVFAACHELGDVHLPDSLTTIGEGAFPEGTVIYSSATAYARTWARENLYTWKHEQHTEEVRAAVEPTCTQSGRTEGLWCAECGEIFVAQELLPALGHTTVTDEAVAPTCTATGLTEGSHCETCGEVFVAQEVLEALGHTEATIPGFEPTCTEPGVKDYLFCETCGEEFQTADEIPALGHTDEISKEAIAPTCTEEGSTEEHACAVCGEVLVPAQTLAPQGHSEYESVGAVAPDCVHAGHTAEIICGVCGVVLTPSEEIPALGHTEEVLEAVAPTCTETGLTEGSRCTICGETIIAQEVVDALGHTAVTDAAVAPTDRETGLTEGSHCGVCGQVLTAQEVIPANFNWDGDVITGYNRENPVVVIPADAVGLSDTAFKNNTFITSVTMGDNILSLGTQTFMGCTGLTDVYLPDHLNNIGAQTFYGVNARVHCSAESATAVALSYRGVPFTTEDGWTLRYRVTSLTGTPSATWIVKYAGEETALVIPDAFNAAPVTQILADAFAENKALTSVTIPETVTLISDRAFENCTALANANFPGALKTLGAYAFHNTALTAAALPSGLTVAGEGAFAGCTALTSATLPEGLTAIADHLFDGCAKLSGVKLPEGIASIGEYVFRGCVKQTSMAVPKGVTAIGKGAFYGCTRLTSVTLPEGLAEIADELFAYCTTLKGVTLPSTVTAIGENAFFMCETLAAITLPEGVTEIGSFAFKGCTALAEIVLPDSLTTLGDGVFAYCSGLGQLVLPDEVTAVGADLLANSSATLYCDANTTTAQTLADAGYGYSPLLTFRTEEKADGTVDVILAGVAPFLKEVVVPEGVTKIADYAFQNHSMLEKVTLPSTLKSIGDYAFNSCKALTSIEIPDGVYSIGEGAFQFCDALASVKLPADLPLIADYTFRNCSALASIEIPEGVETIGDHAFQFCTSLTAVTIPQNVTAIGQSAFHGCDIQELYLPEGITSLGGELHSLYIDVIYLPRLNCDTTAALAAVSSDRVFRITGDDTLAYDATVTENGELYIRVRAVSDAITELVIPEGVHATTYGAFAGCRQLTKVEIPSTLTLLDDHTFDNCSTLESITIPGTVKEVGDNLFYNCVMLKNVTIEEGVTTLGAAVFNICSAIESVELPESVTAMGTRMFQGCTALTDVRLPQNMTAIPEGTFIDCAALTTVTIPEGVTSIGNNAFNNCTVLESITLPDGVTSIGAYAFQKCTSLTRLTVPAGVTSIGEYAFYDCTALAELRLPADVSEIGIHQVSYGIYPILPEIDCLTAFNFCALSDTYRYRLEGCEQLYLRAMTDESGTESITVARADSSITEAVIPEGVTTIASRAFNNCSSLTTVTIPDSVTSIGSYAFSSCSALEALHVHGNVQLIDVGAFGSVKVVLPSMTCQTAQTMTENNANTYWCLEGDESLCYRQITDENGETGIEVKAASMDITEAIIPEGVTDIADSAFSNCTALTSIRIPEGVTSIGDHAFQSCTALASIEIPQGVTAVGYETFCGCESLESVKLPEGLTSIGGAAFLYCPALQSVNVPESVTSIGDNAFTQSPLLTSLRLPANVEEIGVSILYADCCPILPEVDCLTAFTYSSSDGYGNCRYTVEGCEKVHFLATKDENGVATIMVMEHASDVTEVVLPEGVTHLDTYAFRNCTALTSVTLPSTLSVIPGGAFSGCNALENVVIPEGVTEIQDTAFRNCKSLKTLTIPQSVTTLGGEGSIDEAVFYGCSIDTLYLPDGITSFGANAYRGVNAIILPRLNCQTAETFAAHSARPAFRVPGDDTLAYVAEFDANGELTFQVKAASTEITEVVIPEGMSIAADAFANCANLQSVTISEGVTAIGDRAFSGCTALESLFIPDSVQSIGSLAFGDDTSCLIISSHDAYARTWAEGKGMAWQHDAPIPAVRVLPATRENDGMTKHEYCSGCGVLISEGAVIDHSRVLFLPAAIREIADEAFVGNKAVQITLPEGAQSIGSRAFADCDNLLLVVIPSTVSSIADDALEGCEGVTLVISADNAYALAWAEAQSADVFVP